MQNTEVKKRETGRFHLGCSVTLLLKNTPNVEQANKAVIETAIQGYVKFCVCKSFEMFLNIASWDGKRCCTSQKVVRSARLG